MKSNSYEMKHIYFKRILNLLKLYKLHLKPFQYCSSTANTADG